MTNPFAISTIIKQYAEQHSMPETQRFLFNKTVMSEWNTYSGQGYRCAYINLLKSIKI